MTKKEKIRYIISQHQRINQTYCGLPYSVHLIGVVDFIKKFKYLIPEDKFDDTELGGWSHDLLEDVDITFNNVKHVLGETIALMSYRLKNEKGLNRDERANDKYYAGIKEDPLCIYIKICDRISNMVFSKLYGDSGMYEKYLKEYPHFKEMLYTNEYKEMWDFLDNIDLVQKKEDWYEGVEKFNKDTINRIHLPSPIPFECYDELYRKGIIPKNKLVNGKYYLGTCRNASVAVWNGHNFVYMRSKFGTSFPEDINHLEDDNYFDLFVPLEIVKPEEHQIVIYK